MARRPKTSQSKDGLRVRELVEPEQLRAIAHPRRVELIDLLAGEGPLTATQCATRLHDSPASCSYHLRQLARFGFVEEAPGGVGRQRPWRYVPVGNRVRLTGSPAHDAAAEEFFSVIDARNQARLRQFRAAERVDPWSAQGGSSDYSVLMTEAELGELKDALGALFEPLLQRTFDGAAPDDARLVDIVALVMPRPDDRSKSRARAAGRARGARQGDG